MKLKKFIPFLYFGIIFLVPSALSVFMFIYSGSWTLGILTAFPGLDMALIRAKFVTDTLNKSKPYHAMFEKFAAFSRLFLPLAEVLILLLSPIFGGGVYAYGIVFGAIFAPFFTAVFAKMVSLFGFKGKSELKIKSTFLSSMKTVFMLPLSAAKSLKKCVKIILDLILRKNLL